MTPSKITLKCTRCGSTRFEFLDNPSNDDLIACMHCGEVFSYKALSQTLSSEARREIEYLQENDPVSLAGYP